MQDLSSPARDQTCSLADEAWSLNYWTAREALGLLFLTWHKSRSPPGRELAVNGAPGLREWTPILFSVRAF